MANLLSQNIGANYKGILNLNTLNGNLTTTLETITDGMGNASPLQLSTTIVGITTKLNVGGTFTNLATAHFRGDGTNSIARFEDESGVKILEINKLGFFNISNASNFVGWYAIDQTTLLPNKNGFGIAFANVVTSGTSYFFTSAVNKSATAGITSLIKTQDVFAAAAGSANYRPLNIEYTINNSGAQSGTATGIFLNATETNLNGMGHNLMDLKVGGVSRFSVNNAGSTTIGGTFYYVNQYTTTGDFWISASGLTNVLLSNGSLNNFGRLQFGGTTLLFPAIKRNGAGIDFRLADDSGYCGTQDLYNRFGSGSPESVVTAPIGALYHRTDGGANTSIYVKESGTENTGWTAK